MYNNVCFNTKIMVQFEPVPFVFRDYEKDDGDIFLSLYKHYKAEVKFSNKLQYVHHCRYTIGVYYNL